MASLKRIAADLGISYTLVSKVLSGRLGTTGVSPKTREAILKKVKELDYTPNRLAVALKAGRKGAVGIFLHHIGSPGSDVSDRLLRGMAEGLEKSESRMWLRFFTTDEDFRVACDTRLKSEVDGLIVAGAHHPGLMQKFRDLERQNVPVVSIFNNLPEHSRKGLTNVEVNYEAQGYIATKHLLEQGCRRLACFRTLENRTAGFVKAHREAKVKFEPRLLIPTENFRLESGEQSLGKLLKLRLSFDGIVCQSDAQAIGAINELVRHGIKVPEEVKVTGVDNSPVAEDCIVPITSVTSEMKRAGMKAVGILLEKIDGLPVKSAVIEPGLFVRNSSGAEPSQDVDTRDLE
jgi:LacI family transcriptional regulator